MMFPPERQPEQPRLRGFEVLERLGAGGVGSVYLARSKAGRLVAIKMLGDPKAELDAIRKEALAHEASLCARLVHPAIVQVRAFVQDAGYAALVFEYVPGVALARLLRFLASQRVRLPDAAAFHLVERVLAALAYAHAHTDEAGLLVPIVHRDVSPANVLLDWEGVVKLTDFGMAKMLGTSSGTRIGIVEGTLGCMSPEQARGESVNERADVYAAALLAWRLATGVSPFAHLRNDEVELLRAMRNPRFPPLAKMRPDLPAKLLDAIGRALTVDHSARHITAGELRSVVEESIDCEQGQLELRALLTSSRTRLEEMVAAGGVEQTYSIVDASTGHTMRYEEVALTFDNEPHPDAAGDAGEMGALPPATALPPMGVDVSHERPTVRFAVATPRSSLPSLDELTVLSELGVPDMSAPASVRFAPRAGGPTDANETRTVEARSRQAELAQPPARWLVTLLAAAVTLTGIAVGVALAWFALGRR